MGKLINYSEASRMLTNDRTAIRSTDKGKKYKDALNDLKEFEKKMARKTQKVLKKLRREGTFKTVNYALPLIKC